MSEGRARILVAAAALAASAPPALAHVSDRGFVLLLPTGHYLAGGALAVAASFAVLTMLPRGAPARLDAARLPLPAAPGALRAAVNAAATIAFLLLLAAGWAGSRDPLSNPLPLTVWTLLWVGATVVQGLVFDLWAWINPWRAPAMLIARMVPASGAADRLGRRLGYWPAIVQFLGFAWFELVDPAPDDPARLATVAALYFALNLMAMAAFGFGEWSRRGECLSAFFGVVGRFAAVGRAGSGGGGGTVLAWPGARLADSDPLPPSGVLFLLLALSSVSFDGLSRTFAWLAATGVNPLEYPGRTAVMPASTLGLLGMFALLAAAFLGAVALGRRMAAAAAPFRVVAGTLVWSIVPIALAYHVAHYLTVMMVNGQYALVALSDPFAAGWDLFGTAGLQVMPGVTLGSEAAALLWNVQVASIVLGHVLAVASAHGAAERLVPGRRAAMLLELPLAGLMVAYTAFGLWLLSTPTGA